jgi:hypothetical protein
MTEAVEASGDHQGTCANCGAVLAGPFCGQCGQRAHLHRSIGDVVHEFVHGITHLDGKAWTTLPMLLLRPGQLTRDYIAGRRARHIGPVPLFLMVVFLMFFALSFVGVNDNRVAVEGTDPARRPAEIGRALADLDSELANARRNRNQAEVNRLLLARAGLEALRDRGAAGSDDGAAALVNDIAAELSTANAKGELRVDSGVPWLDEKARAALQNPSLMLYKLQTKAYKLSFLLVPLSLPWLWLVFAWRRDVGLYEHAVFALYSISFMSLLFVAASLMISLDVTAAPLWLAVLLAPAAHMVAQLRGAYGIGWFGAAWRTMFLAVAANMTIGLYLALLVVLGVMD